MPKFLCVKGILFFSFWQSICISLLVSVGVIKHIGSYTDVEHISLAITDTLICYEMPLFAIAHSYAFSTSDFTDPSVQHVARMPFLHALRDAFGLLDVIVDARDTLRGGVSYQAYEPAEGGMHQGTGRDRRIRAGLRYAAGGRKKYWLPMPADDTTTSSIPTPGILTKARRAIEEQNAYAPLTDAQASQVVHSESSSSDSDSGHLVVPGAFDVQFESSRSLAIVRFRKSKREDGMYDDARKLVFGDYNYPVVDCSSERARERIWDAEEQILRDQRAAAFHPDLGGVVPHRLGGSKGYGATDANGKLGPRGVYGKWAADGDDEEEEEEDTGSIKSRGELEGGKVRPKPGQKLDIDMREGKRPDLKVGGVDLKWHASSSGSGSRSGSGSGKDARRTRSGKDARLRPEPPRSRSHSNTPSRTESPSTRSNRPLPPDAVDLVVEDKDAAEQAASRERRKGDPALRPGGKKVYRRGYVLEDGRDVEVSVEERERAGSIDQTKVRVQDTHRRSPNPVQPTREERAKDQTDDKHGGGPEVKSQTGSQTAQTASPSSGGAEEPTEVDTEVTIVRAGTPPPHAHVSADAILPEALSNPWA
ncbi:Transmembrane protein 184 homolog C30D11,06c OS=Schizosaccharomyces pombe (strain 972 / ATCC 24843) GN=SPAC30D11.06c PE=1 SV=1 [Rhizoctonia solani AG-1 IB]|uniref:Transmembrane protein 184 homolog C30D11,06c n=1 Tax=Thanatephorus cucumeris (strain AG1-IB / isolate 7/3/14) TaxID=1108050 RepID=A0A0B7G317_THACB|nr:Transmembrane protein 184 homolog C30D11,06c OS=Schizosaccharomyces pombe (strain 972 / ATCC 24843) GN=SPAC30D11.06c PE=1 SV=1 [Rhizoctonia solani AG-1 IB]